MSCYQCNEDFIGTLMVKAPLLKKGSRFYFEIQTGRVYGMDLGPEKGIANYPLRTGLAAYLWLLSSGKEIRIEKENV